MLDKEYEIDFYNDLLNYNHERYLAHLNNTNFVYNNDFERVLSARYMKVSRIKKRLVWLLSRYDYIWFCTFTFNDYYINKSDRTKRDLIKSCINKFDFQYILNIDYGKTTEREHYHCILATNWSFNINDYLQKNYSCFCNAKQCRVSIADLKRLSKYINKLTNHCIKSTTKRQRIVYNFSGYDNFKKLSEHEKWVMYQRDMLALLDKANIT